MVELLLVDFAFVGERVESEHPGVEVGVEDEREGQVVGVVSSGVDRLRCLALPVHSL